MSLQLQPVPCPHEPWLMVFAVQFAFIAETDNDVLGLALMEVLRPDQRLRLFRAIEWFRDNPLWDRLTYAEAA